MERPRFSLTKRRSQNEKRSPSIRLATYVKSTEKTTTGIKLWLDRFIGEVLPDPPRQAKAHLISVIGGDTQIAAASAAISLGDRFMLERPGVQPIRVCLERNAQCFKGSVQLAGRKKPLRHLVALSEEFASTNVSAGSGRTLLASSENGFIWAALAHIHGIPGMPDWADWFAGELETHKAIIRTLGIGCKLFPTASGSNSDASSAGPPDLLVEPRLDPTCLVAAALDTSTVVAFGQRPDALARKRRGRPVFPEQASLFSLS
jgi:hypothetical protein